MASVRRAAAGTGTGARWTTLQTNDQFTIDEVEVIVRHPALPDWERQDVRNDDSIVLELRWRDVSIVLTGDIGRETEQAIAGLFPPAGIRVLKVPHHGSLTSSSRTFLDTLAPRVAIFSVGRNNTFGHPGAGRVAPLPGHQRADLPDRPGRSRDGRHRWLLGQESKHSREGHYVLK